MENRQIGSLTVSAIGLGLRQLRHQLRRRTSPSREPWAVIDAAIDHGITLLDTADVYGDSEAFLREALRGRRDRVVLATKFGGRMGADDRQGASARWIATAVEDSLRRLGHRHHRPVPAASP